MSFDFLWQGFGVALLPQNLLIGLIGCFLGTMIGALPAIGPINGIALLLPIAYTAGLPPESTLILLAGVYYGAEYGGRISSILLNVPGDAGAVMTALDGYPMARRGEATKALAISGISSFIGGILAVVGMTFLAVPLSWLAIKFGPAEYFVLMVFAFATLGSMVGHEPAKTLIGCVLGLMLTTIGLDATSGAYRFTFEQAELHDGIEFIILVIGLFSISEVLLMLEHQLKGTLRPLAVSGAYPSWADIRFIWWPSVRATVIGFVIGVLPGTGASVASAVSYTTEKRLNDKEGTFGTGDMRGLAAPEAANNAAATGAFVPMLTLGVPGSGTTAVMLGALMLYNIQPGPQLFVEQPKLVGGLIASMYVGNLLLLVMNLPLVQLFARVLLMPNWILIPGITALSILGVYSAYASVMSVLIMFGIGVAGYLLRKLGFDMAPIILGFVLGRVMEVNLRNALALSGGDPGILFASPLAIILWIMAGAIVILPWWLRRRARPTAVPAA
ncbi:tripartite tricarboxylate transporter permease [Rhabdaerophilum calidifontis]|uniref:tripartite tricarboxylate transporter permease n=1 Tax=Rhabdaerophilum calidifontis TaxID=2604328 RepID=UPI00123B8415|nr:tripartite tricarboxylate transporter permease [Rhabdaerophilum calidifontis]